MPARRPRPALAALVAASAVTLALLMAAPASGEEEALTASPDALVAAGLIVEYAPGTPAREAPGVPTGADSVSVTDIEVGRPIGDGLRTVEFAEPESAAVALAAAEQLESDPAVLFAEPDWEVRLAEASTIVAPRASQASPPWGIDRVDQRSGTNGTYVYGTTGQGVDVYVIDTGIRATHVDLVGRVATGTNFYPGVTGSGDCNGHGTHVAGTIGGTQYGIAKQATLIPVRVFGCSGGTWTSTIVSAIAWVRNDHTGARPAVINMSLGGGASSSLDTAVAEAVADGITVVVASGNDDEDACLSSPARAPDAITVNASTSSDDTAYFTNWGRCTDIFAPGLGVQSAWYNSDTATETISGTSMASPHVAGAAARILQGRPSWSPDQVWFYMSGVATAVTFRTPSPDTPNKLLYVDPIAFVGPDAPTGVAAAPDYDELDVTWTAPAEGLQPAWYAVQYSANGTTWIDDDTTVTRSATIDALNPATAYLVRVRSVLGDDSSAWATSTTAVQPLAPTAPSAVTGIAPLAIDDTTLSVTWTPPVSAGGRAITHYTVQHSTDDSTWLTDDTTATASTTLMGLAPGTPVRVRVSAVNVIGTGTSATSATLVAPRTLAAPGAPGTIRVTPGNASLALTWSAPTDTGGRPVTSYVVQHSTDDSTWTSLAPVATTSTTITGLANGRSYFLRVAATSTQGTGAWTTATGTPVAPPPPPPPPPPPGGGGGGGGAAPPPPPPAPVITKPGAPTITDTGVDDGSLLAVWAASDDTGGDSPTAFTVEIGGPQATITREVAEAFIEVTDLDNGTPYRVRVAATNSAGTGAWSAWSEDLVPRGPATSPTGLVAVARDSSAVLSWRAPQDDGGSPVSGYVIEVSARGLTQELMVDDTSTVLAGLTNGVAHTIRVAAETDFGLGAWSTAVTVTPKGPPVGAPQAVKAVRDPRKLTVTWSAPEVGSPLRYIVTASIDGKAYRVVRTTKETSVSFPVKSTARTVRVQVAAVDRYGKGPATAPVASRRP